MKGTKRLPDVVDQVDHMEEAEADQEYQGEYETVELGPAHSGTHSYSSPLNPGGFKKMSSMFADQWPQGADHLPPSSTCSEDR